ncbi:ribonuclease P protein component [Candidatus Saccharibacteria bacterium]|nr:ribonuclease P protein component [Candidatus Saccharibacteria bacterium]
MINSVNRFHGHGSLRFVYKNGEAVRSHLFTIKYIQNPRRKKSRIAIVISKKVVKGAVKRNRIRRRIYEIIRLRLPHFTTVYDVALIAISSELLNISHHDLSQQIDELLRQAGIIK